MQRNVYLQGELGEKFGTKFVVNTDDYADIFRCINANRPDFLPYLRKCHEEDIGFILDTEEGELEHEDLLVPAVKGDITLALAPAGSKKGITKILAAIAIIAVIYFTGGFAGLGTGTVTAVGPGQVGWAVAAGGGLSTAGSMVVLFSANLALAGIQQIMAPDPAVDQDAPTNYLFSGGPSNAKEGDPVPLLYGELRVPGRPIAIEVIQGRGSNSGYLTDNTYVDANGNIITHHTTTAEVSTSLN
jgi:predicted phage tail protein